MEEQYWVQIDGDSPYVTSDSGRLWAMLFGVMVGVGMSSASAHAQANSMTDSAVTDQERVEELKDGRILRLTIFRPGEADE